MPIRAAAATFAGAVSSTAANSVARADISASTTAKAHEPAVEGNQGAPSPYWHRPDPASSTSSGRGIPARAAKGKDGS